MKVRVIWLDLMIKYGLAGLNELIFRTRLSSYLKVDELGKFLRQFEIDYLIFSLECRLQKLLDHFKGFVDKKSVVFRVNLLHQFMI